MSPTTDGDDDDAFYFPAKFTHSHFLRTGKRPQIDARCSYKERGQLAELREKLFPIEASMTMADFRIYAYMFRIIYFASNEDAFIAFMSNARI